MCTTLPLLYPPNIVAACAVYAATKALDEKIIDEHSGRPWYQVLDIDPSILRGIKQILSVY